ncbi:hypothetical protein B0H11DRAFT_1917506 [Mycena galericulata]|nr:hypothetical protein B0H11DRAFT_1917506 [Mycena galericulata]
MPRAFSPRIRPWCSHLPPRHRVTSLAARRHVDHLFGDLLDFETQIATMIWIEDDVDPLQITLYPREDLRVRLSDHREILAAVGFEEVFAARPERYVRDAQNRGDWMPCTWDTPLRVYSPGDPLLLCHEAVTVLKDFEIHERHMR